MIITFDSGSLDQLTDYFNNNSFELRLFVNDITPAEEDDLGDYIEASGGGYAAKTISGGWAGSIVLGDAQVAITIASFTFSGALTTNPTIYGWYLTRGSVLVMADKMAVPFTPSGDGDKHDITITYKGVNHV